LQESEIIQHSFAEKTCQMYNVNVYQPAQLIKVATDTTDQDNCLVLQESYKEEEEENDEDNHNNNHHHDTPTFTIEDEPVMNAEEEEEDLLL
jgi:hypothetical protein